MVNSSVSIESARLEARHALIVYAPKTPTERRIGYHHDQSQPVGYVSVHDILLAGSELRLGTGRPVNPDVLATMLTNVGRELKGSGFMPDRILALQGCGGVVWWTPPQRRLAWFRTRNTEKYPARDLAVEVPYPGLVFSAKGRQLRVFAVKGKARPKPETVLHGCPVMNVFQDARLCTGTIKVPSGKWLDLIEPWETGFFDSVSTSPNPGQDNQINHKGGMLDLWNEIIDKTPATFPEAKLRPFPGGRLTVGMLVEGKV